MTNEKLEWGPYEGRMKWDAAVKLAASKGSGWRLPTVAELVSQYDYDAAKPKNDDWQGWYWSSSPGGDDGAWLVYFDDGFVSYDSRGYEYGVRCVREAGSISTDRHIDSSRAYAAELRALADHIERGE
jgi:hypothetical protein